MNLIDTAYVAVGAADKAAELARTVPAQLAETRGRVKTYVDTKAKGARTSYEGYATRGRNVVADVRNDERTQRALRQTEAARTQVRNAVSGVTRAFETSQDAVESAAGRIGLRRANQAA